MPEELVSPPPFAHRLAPWPVAKPPGVRKKLGAWFQFDDTDVVSYSDGMVRFMFSLQVGVMTARSAALALLRIGAAAVALMIFAHSAVADDQEESKHGDSEEFRETARLIQAELPRWKIGIGAEGAELKLHPKPILRWTNPATGRMYGEIYVWTANGRPESVISLYKVWEPAWGFAGELQSLSATNLVAKRDQSVAWKCEQPGIALRDVPDAPTTAATARRRLQQMRAIADDFSAVLIDCRQNPGGERQALRLLTNPVFRYSSPGREVVDGAIFAFVVGTDPEALLLLEAHEKKNKKSWQYALARLNCDELAAFFKEQEVWRVGRAAYEEREKPYVFMSLSESPPQE